MNKYKYTIKTHLVKDFQELQNILNEYGYSGCRVFRVEKMDHCIYEGGTCKYIVYLEEKIKNVKNEQSPNKHNKTKR
jgi:hypothetical protein